MNTRKLEQLEETVMEALVSEINECNDPVDSFKAIERYAAFTKARTTRLTGESVFAGVVSLRDLDDK